MIDDLKMIKKFYGEKMMHLCRELFPTLLESPGLLYRIFNSNFRHSRDLYYDICESKSIIQFKDYIYALADEKELEENVENRTPQELLDEAGYILHECHNYDDIQFFKKYYKQDEALCTFWDDRLSRCYVFFAVKKNALEIKREDFINPQRQDEYGTSVISIQFTKGRVNTLSIKNRYNHRVKNPDSTFNNNLDEIILGLSDSFCHHYGFNFKNNIYSFELNDYVKANDGKYYKYNYEINNIYYCPGNIIIDNFEVKNDYEKSAEYIIIDYFILDIPNKKIQLYDSNIKDSFIDGIKNISKIEVIKMDDNSKVIYIETKNSEENDIIEISVDKNNKIIGYKNEKLTKIDDGFLTHNSALTDLNLPVLKQIGDDFLYNNISIEALNLPLLNQVGDSFLCKNTSLIALDLPLLNRVGGRFLYDNKVLAYLNLPSLNRVGDRFLYDNNALTELKLPLLEQAGDRFLSANNSLTKLSLPLLEQVGSHFLYYNETLTELSLPSLIQTGDYFLGNNSLKEEFLRRK